MKACLLFTLNGPNPARMLLYNPAVRKAVNALILEGRPEGKRITATLIVIGMSVPGMDGHIQIITSFDEMRPLDFKADSAAGRQPR